ncbi:MarR family winged helix-turn-helix transcriptional regulator [Solimicrobium silvestre]|uniref:Transcriptional regulator n=1 Tax=Solimicrobium silvestre TaxID=2099400 RepID=A0A2S9H4D6_9BURK|nr:MarR family winged helix-turn-helix transcriptional regulator [Solimicrobium silvestre]PRC94827.1 Transcriptional regulator [Solimicrobium silvestre]
MNANTEPSASLDFCLQLTRATATIICRIDNAPGNLHGLSFSDFMLLLTLSRAVGEHMRRDDLAESLGLSASGITRTLIPMEKIGLVTRHVIAQDSRAGYAVLSKTGKELLAHALVSTEAISQEVIQTTNQEQLDALSAALDQLARLNLSNN